jgi:hypothetical protein
MTEKKIDCDKRQQEVVEGEEQHRCIEPKTPDTYLQIVDTPTCEGCPLMAIKAMQKGASCKDQSDGPHWSDELLGVVAVASDPLVVHSTEAKQGYEQSCSYRWNNKCRVTGHQVNPEICKACDQETADEMANLGLVGKAAKWGNAVRKWILKGRPVRTDEEVDYIFNTFCKGCELFDPVEMACKKCACNVNTDKAPLANKLKMKTETCPMHLWK